MNDTFTLGGVVLTAIALVLVNWVVGINPRNSNRAERSAKNDVEKYLKKYQGKNVPQPSQPFQAPGARQPKDAGLPDCVLEANLEGGPDDSAFLIRRPEA